MVGTAIAGAAGLSPDGSTSGITSVLVFGAGTNYALLLISRYREELGRTADHRAALRVAVRNAGPAIVASNATVVLALLTLVFASSPSTRSLGVQAASGLLVAAVLVLLVLPPLLALCGRRLFWPFIPHVGAKPLTDSGIWHRIADAVARRPGRVAVVAIAGLAVLCTGLLGTPIGLSQTEQFRVQAESVSGYETLAAHFPSGLTDPTRVIAPTDRAADIQRAITATPGVVSATPSGQSAGLTQWSVVLDAAPASDDAFETVDALRDSVHKVDPAALVGGSDAQARDASAAAVRDRLIVIPAILAVVLLVLYVLLRSALAPLILVAVTVLSALAALGLGGWASVHVFGFPALDNATPLFAFLFLVALGVDYTIFLVTRAREETPHHGTRARHRAGGLGDRRSHHQRGHRAGRGLLRPGRASPDRPHPDRDHRRPRHPAGHLRRAHRHHSGVVHTDRSANLVAGPARGASASVGSCKSSGSTPCSAGCTSGSAGTFRRRDAVLAQPADDGRYVGRTGRPLRR